MSLVVLAPSAPNPDDGLHVSRWVADRVLGELELSGTASHRLLDMEATRERLLLAADAGPEGLLAFSHGGEEGLSSVEAGRHHPLLTLSDLSRWSGRWIYAFACRSGEHLADAAIAAGVARFAGYRGALHVDWDPDQLPDELVPLVERMVVTAALRVARRDRDVRKIQAELSPIADQIIDWIDLNLEPGADLSDPRGVRWLQATAHQLVNNLVLKCAELGPEGDGVLVAEVGLLAGGGARLRDR